MKWQSMIRKLNIAMTCKEGFKEQHNAHGCCSALPLLFTILACISLASCRTQYIELPSSHSSIEVALRRDSITRDHYCYIFLKGDTVYKVDSIREYVEHSTTDTIVRVDSVSYPVPVPVPGDMTKRQQFLYNSGIAGWIILIAALIIGALIAAIKIFTHK